MKKHKISYSDTQSFSKIIQMYTEEKVSKKFYNRYPNINQFEDQIKKNNLVILTGIFYMKLLKIKMSNYNFLRRQNKILSY